MGMEAVFGGKFELSAICSWFDVLFGFKNPNPEVVGVNFPRIINPEGPLDLDFSKVAIT